MAKQLNRSNLKLRTNTPSHHSISSKHAAQQVTLPELPSTSLVICSRNRPKLLLETVESVLKGEQVPSEIVIIDQSDERSLTLPNYTSGRNCKIRYLWQKSAGVGLARNMAIRTVQHDLIVFIDDDMLATPTWFGSITRALVHAGLGAAVTGQVLEGRPEVNGGFAPSTNMDQNSAVYEGRIGKDVLYTNNMALYGSVFFRIGTFDERLGVGARFPAAVDNDFCFRLLEAGYKILYIPEAVLYHRAWRSKHSYPGVMWNYGRGQGGYYAKHMHLRDSYMLRRMIWDILKSLLYRFPLNLIRQPCVAHGDIVYALGLVCGAFEWLMTQPRSVPKEICNDDT